MTEVVQWPPIGGTNFNIPEDGETNWPELTEFLVALAQAQGTKSQKVAVRRAIATPATLSAGNDCFLSVELGTPAPAVVNLPAGNNGQYFSVIDGLGVAGTHNITVNPAPGETIQGNTDYVMNANGASVGLSFINGDWKVVWQAAGEGSAGGIARSSIDAGTPNYVIINAPDGKLGQEQFLAAARGGLGVSAGAATGYVKFTAGAASFIASIPGTDLSGGIAASKIGNGDVTNPVLSYLANVTSDIQAQLNAKQATGNYITALTGDVTAAGPGSSAATIAANAVTTTKILDSNVTTAKLADLAVTTVKLADSSVSDAKVSTGISASKIGTGIVDNTEFGYLDGLSGNAQAQLNGKLTSPMTTKGDLIGFSTVPVRLPVGANDLVLTADSSQAAGVAWKTGGSGSGGLSPVAVSSSGTSTINTSEEIDVTGGAITRTLPVIPAGGGIISFTDAFEVASATNFIRLTPGAGNTIDGYGADSLVMRRARDTTTLVATPGSTVWRVHYTSNTIPQGGQIPGIASSAAIGSGFIGQTIRATQPTTVGFPASNTYGDVTFLDITEGAWSVTGVVDANAGGGNISTVLVGISNTAGNSAAGLVDGDNFGSFLPPTAASNIFAGIPSVPFNVAVTTRLYLKIRGTYTTGSPVYRGRLSAVRVG